YLYCGEIILRNQDRETILELLVASDEFGLTKLIDYVQQYFGENIKTHLSQNPIDILHLVAQHDAFNEIRKLSLETI
ncbi:9922_t:CDS:1, partial [Gigaspora rosea]